MSRNCILDLPLSVIMKQEIALPLQHVGRIYTVGQLLVAWRNPKNHRQIERFFDSPQQARHAVAICAGWIGMRSGPMQMPVTGWWIGDERGAVEQKSHCR